MKKMLSVALFWVLATGVCAESNVAPYAQELEVLAQDTQWLQLLAYDAGTRSAVTSAGFFMAANGYKDPYSELIATLLHFAEPDVEGNAHAQCRFPARYRWLKQRLNFSELAIQPVDCPDFHAFSGAGSAESISVIFATGYLGNPASYYGHLLLRINAPQLGATSLESAAVNFGARIPPDENMLVYIAKGLWGGYDASFTHQKYFYHTLNYGETELRDLWEYELQLDAEDLELLVAHIWELLGVEYTYYFLNRNCAYRVGEVLQLVTDERLVAPWRPWSAPQEIMQGLGEIVYKDRPLVKAIHYIPSRQSRLYGRYADLSSEERRLLATLVGDIGGLEHAAFNNLLLEQQHKLLDALLDYYQFVRDDSLGLQDINNEYYRLVLAKRFQLPAGGSEIEFSSLAEPHQGRKPSYLNVGLRHHDVGGEFMELWLRPAYYDSLDAGYGHIKNASLAMGELKLGVTRSEAFVRELNLVRIESLSRNFTGLPGDRHHSWYLEAGAEQAYLGCVECLATKFRSGYGYGTSLLGDRLVAAGFAGVGLLARSWTSDELYGAGSVVLNFHLGSRWSARIDAEQRIYRHVDNESRYQIQGRLSLGKDADIRLHFARDRSQELGISIGTYW